MAYEGLVDGGSPLTYIAKDRNHKTAAHQIEYVIQQLLFQFYLLSRKC